MRSRTLGLALLLLAACDEAPTPAPVPEPRAQTGRALLALRESEARLRARLRDEGTMAMRATQLHAQAMPDTIAVCGHVNPDGQRGRAWLPYVAVVAFEGEAVARTELFLAASSPEATRVFFEMVDRCFEGGGPAHARLVARPLPPGPVGLVAPEAAPEPAPAVEFATGPAAAPQAAESGTAPLGSVTIGQRAGANVRNRPSGAGEVLMVAPRGATLQVFAVAPGGWVQVGEGTPWGWVHGSLLEAR